MCIFGFNKQANTQKRIISQKKKKVTKNRKCEFYIFSQNKSVIQ